VLVVVEVLVFVVGDMPPAGDGFTMVVLYSVRVLGDGDATAGATVSVLCSHAARSEALARMQIYFFIVTMGEPDLGQS